MLVENDYGFDWEDIEDIACGNDTSMVAEESGISQLRKIAKAPYKVLDAPYLEDNFYLNLVDWSQQNVLGVGLRDSVYIWSAQNSQVKKLCQSS